MSRPWRGNCWGNAFVNAKLVGRFRCLPLFCCRIICMRSGRCRRGIRTTRPAGRGSRRSSRNAGWQRELESPRFPKLGSEGRRGVWQPRFWEHSIRDEDDYERHFDYIHYNPVKHGYVRCPHEWPHSSFHRWVRADVYPWHWACWGDAQRMLEFPEIVDTVGE